MSSVEDVKKDLRLYADFEKANVLQRFFKTGKGDYGEGDVFLGISVPNTRKVAKKNIDISLSEIKRLLYSKIHEERLCSLLILVNNFENTDEPGRRQIFDFYIKNSKQVNNWDLVDLSAPRIVGRYLLNKPKRILYDLVESNNLWKRRVSIISTLAFIKNSELKDTFKLAKILIKDKHDLIHKAVGWMLREAGKVNVGNLEKFLDKFSYKMPRIMLRYAIEKFPENERQKYLNMGKNK
ncbi:MAG: DNA alkylation repair protein [Candidatus Paceibacterota bacterium]|jgi:3-methyladenine DNA glycosylase AlkD